MSDVVQLRDIAALGSLLRLSDQASVTAGGAGDATTVTGVTVDRASISGGFMPQSAEIAVLFAATLAAGKSLTVTFDVQDSADGVNFSDYSTTAGIVAATSSAGGTVKGQVDISVNLQNARRFVRLLFVPDLSATGTDTATAIAAGFFGGFEQVGEGL